MKTKVITQSSVDDEDADARLRSFSEIITGELCGFISKTQPPPSIAAAERQVSRHLKKAEFSDNFEKLRQEALLRFIDTNDRVAKESLLPDSIARDASLFIRNALERWTLRNTGDVQETLDLGLLLDGWRCGKGASASMPGITHFVDKLKCQRPTVTRKALPLAKLLRQTNPHFRRAYDGRFISDLQIVEGSCTTTVPKNEDNHRTTSSEPLYNMMLQLAAATYIEGALRCVGLDISTQQPKNKRLAEVGSINGSLATIDLKSASDLISPALIRQLWPTEWFYLFSVLRSDSTFIDGELIDLKMMSTMGNGFTFPMMTLTLLAIIYACVPSKPLYVDYSTCAVFGDDIIVPSTYYKKVVEVLSMAGLIVNLDKSYHEGLFRESCGGDYYAGVDITPFYVKKLANDSDVYVAINQLTGWVSKTGIPLWDTLDYLLSLLDGRPLLVPCWAQPDSGILSSEVSGRYKYWKPVLNRKEIPVDLPGEYLIMLLIIGGYVTSAGASKLCYIVRSETTEYVLDDARMPRGYRDGAVPGFRSSFSRNFLRIALQK